MGAIKLGPTQVDQSGLSLILPSPLSLSRRRLFNRLGGLALPPCILPPPGSPPPLPNLFSSLSRGRTHHRGPALARNPYPRPELRARRPDEHHGRRRGGHPPGASADQDRGVAGDDGVSAAAGARVLLGGLVVDGAGAGRGVGGLARAGQGEGRGGAGGGGGRPGSGGGADDADVGGEQAAGAGRVPACAAEAGVGALRNAAHRQAQVPVVRGAVGAAGLLPRRARPHHRLPGPAAQEADPGGLTASGRR